MFTILVTIIVLSRSSADISGGCKLLDGTRQVKGDSRTTLESWEFCTLKLNVFLTFLNVHLVTQTRKAVVMPTLSTKTATRVRCVVFVGRTARIRRNDYQSSTRFCRGIWTIN